jgi:hypothetical protein
MRNGEKAVIDKCPVCFKCPDPRRVFLPLKNYDWNTLPLFQDEIENSLPCNYIGCKRKGTELHHFAPKKVFGDYDNWPTGYLCKYHHKLWHLMMDK